MLFVFRIAYRLFEGGGARKYGYLKTSTEFEEHFFGKIKPIREKLAFIDESREGALHAHLGIAPVGQVPTASQVVSGEQPPMTLGI